MALRKSQVLLPEVFRTTKNRKFLNATVDQLISENATTKINNFIGRKDSLNYQVNDGYITELTPDL
jgi:hypothetical protein